MEREKVDILDKALVDAQFVAIPGLGTLAARRLSGGDLEGLGGQADRTLDAEVLALGTLDELGADLFEGGHLARGEGDADLVRLGRLAGVLLVGLVVRHLVSREFDSVDVGLGLERVPSRLER